jgi:2-phospho-L-lactate guanylyltransferase
MTIWAIIPVKPLSDVKRRLAHTLSAAERAALIQRFLSHELAVLCQVAAVQPLVVTSDGLVAALARQQGAEVLLEAAADGLNPGVARGVAFARAWGASGVLILPADLPFLSREDIRLLLQTAHMGQNGHPQPIIDSRPLMTISADKTGEGTNALLLAPPVEFTFHYGPDSFRRHIAEAVHRGLTCRLVSTPSLSFDLDTEADWRYYCEWREGVEIGD